MRTRLAMVLLAASTAAPAQQLGTLFHSPQEREALERQRRGEPQEAGAAPVVTHEPVVTGYVKRSDGKSTVFIDKRPYAVRDARLQGLLGPRVVERYEPAARPAATAPSLGPAAGANAPRPKGVDEPKSPAPPPRKPVKDD